MFWIFSPLPLSDAIITHTLGLSLSLVSDAWP
jgi:hypothetical protein